MGVAGIGIWQLLIILAIALLLFGSGRLRNLGGDLGTAIRGFRSAVREDASAEAEAVTGEADKEQATASGQG
jgi:sec-independent protein translocase protein TatA